MFTTDNYTKTSVLNPHFDWNAGVRLCLGYCETIRLDWTHYQSCFHQQQLTDSNDLTNRNNQQGMFPIWSIANDIIPGDYVSDTCFRGKLTFDLFDLTYSFQDICLNPYVGLRGALIRQCAHVNYEGGIFVIGIIDGGIPLNGDDLIYLKNDFWGIGPRLGLAPEYELGCGFSLYADGAISGLLGSFHIHQREIYLDIMRSYRNKHLTRFRWIGDLRAGVMWKTCWCGTMFSVGLGYEYHCLFHQLELKDRFQLIPSNRNLSTQGLTISASMEF